MLSTGPRVHNAVIYQILQERNCNNVAPLRCGGRDPNPAHHAIQHHATQCLVVQSLVMQSHVMWSWHVLQWHVMPCHVMPCHDMQKALGECDADKLWQGLQAARTARAEYQAHSQRHKLGAGAAHPAVRAVRT